MSDKYKHQKRIKNPLELLEEIQSFLSSRLGCDEPVIGGDDMKGIKDSIDYCIQINNKG